MVTSVAKWLIRHAVPLAAIGAIAALFALPGAAPVSAQNTENGFYNAALPPAGAQHVKDVWIVAQDTVQEIAPGV